MATNRPVTGEHVTDIHVPEPGKVAAVHKPDPVSEYAAFVPLLATATNRPDTGEYVTVVQSALLGMVADVQDDPLLEYATVLVPYATATNLSIDTVGFLCM
jgi:hypothetical protein